MRPFSVLFSFVLGLLAAGAAISRADETSTLEGVVMISRHGVRSSLSSPESEKRLSDKPWPKWDVPRGHLTAHGYRVMKLFGAYYGDYFRSEGLLAPGNADFANTYIRSNVIPRTVATAKALGEGMFPGETIVVDNYAAQGGTRRGNGTDPLFSPESNGAAKPDPAGAFMVATTLPLESRVEVLRPAMKEIATVLGTVEPKRGEKLAWWQLPSSYRKNADTFPSYIGPVTRASAAADNFFMEYLENRPAAEVGWGKVGPAELARFSAPHVAWFGLRLGMDAGYAARVEFSTMGDRILATLETMKSGKAVPGALGKPGDKLVLISGHDSTIYGVSVLFGFKRRAPDGLADGEILPGSALLFELRKDRKTGREFVRTVFLCQTMEQIRHEIPVTLAAPPFRCPVAVRACKTTGATLDQDWDDFDTRARRALDRTFVLKP